MSWASIHMMLEIRSDVMRCVDVSIQVHSIHGLSMASHLCTIPTGKTLHLRKRLRRLSIFKCGLRVDQPAEAPGKDFPTGRTSLNGSPGPGELPLVANLPSRKWENCHC